MGDAEEQKSVEEVFWTEQISVRRMDAWAIWLLSATRKDLCWRLFGTLLWVVVFVSLDYHVSGCTFFDTSCVGGPKGPEWVGYEENDIYGDISAGVLHSQFTDWSGIFSNVDYSMLGICNKILCLVGVIFGFLVSVIPVVVSVLETGSCTGSCIGSRDLRAGVVERLAA